MDKIPLSKIGPTQLIDVEHSGNEVHDHFFRTCTVLQGDPPKSAIGDDVPFRIARLYGTFGSDWRRWNRHFIAQVAGCPLRCWYCYVDNLKCDEEYSVDELVRGYARYRQYDPSINVFHLMGGCPGRYAHMWPHLRGTLDAMGFTDTVLLTDVILLEDLFYDVKPWTHIPPRTIVSVCLKGTSFRNFLANTKKDLFAESMWELGHYVRLNSLQVYYTLIEWSACDEKHITRLLGWSDINWLKTNREYAAVKRRLGEDT